MNTNVYTICKLFQKKSQQKQTYQILNKDNLYNESKLLNNNVLQFLCKVFIHY